MSIANVLALFALCIPLVLSVTAAAVRICSKLEKISAVLENMVSRSECVALRNSCWMKEPYYRKKAAASRSPASAARRKSSMPRV